MHSYVQTYWLIADISFAIFSTIILSHSMGRKKIGRVGGVEDV